MTKKSTNFLAGAISPPPSPAPRVTVKPASEFERAQQHPRIVDEQGAQQYRGPKPTKGLYRGGESMT